MSDNQIKPLQERGKEVGSDQQDMREQSPEERLQSELQKLRAAHKSVVEFNSKSYQCRYRPTRFQDGSPLDWAVQWVEVPAGTQEPEQKPMTEAAKAFSRARPRPLVKK